ncbi:MAG: twin-arginine translocase TatA/TatE family subunit [Planctomycetota bacterium]
MFGLGPLEIVIVGAIAVMLYGKRLPEVGRSFGKTVGDLRRQWQQFSRELEVAAHVDAEVPTSRQPRLARRHDDEPAGSRVVESPRFDPPPG